MEHFKKPAYGNLGFWYKPHFNIKNCKLNVKTSRVTRVTLVLWIGNETLHELSRFGNAFCVTIVWSPYRITPIHWLMARRRPWRTHVVSLYRRTRHLLLRFLCRKEPCRQREELGSKRSVSFPIQRTRVTQVTREVLFHRFTYAVWAFTLWERYTKHTKLKRCLPGPIMNQSTYGRFKQTGSENLEPY